MGAQPEIKAVAEQLQELNAQKPPFRKTAALLLGDVTEILLQASCRRTRASPNRAPTFVPPM